MSAKFSFTALAAVCAMAGCKDDGIRVYRVSKPEATPPAAMPAMPAVSAIPEEGNTQISDKPPTGWKAQPRTAMRQASFLVNGSGGGEADVSLIRLGGPAGGVLENVNRWLGQLGRAAISEDELTRISEMRKVPLGEARIVDLEGLAEGADSQKDGRILAAMVPTSEGTYFFKMRGNADLVSAQKSDFLDWIGSVRMGGAEQGALAP